MRFPDPYLPGGCTQADLDDWLDRGQDEEDMEEQEADWAEARYNGRRLAVVDDDEPPWIIEEDECPW